MRFSKSLRGLDLSNELQDGRIRRLGGGQKRTVLADETLQSDLAALQEPTTIGDPTSPLRWTTKSSRSLAQELKVKCHKSSHSMVADLWHELAFSPPSNRKNLEGAPALIKMQNSHP